MARQDVTDFSERTSGFDDAGIDLGLHVLEPRMMFDGAALATVADAPVDETPDTSPPDEQADEPAGVTSGQEAPRKEIVFVDQGVENYQSLIAALDAELEVVVLDPTRDGMQQIA